MRIRILAAMILCGSLVACSAPQNTPDENAEIAKYERWVQELRAKDALTRRQLEERSESYTAAQIRTADRLRKLRDLLPNMSEDEANAALTAIIADLDPATPPPSD